MSVERTELAPGFEISRVLTGLWQVADLEREGDELDPAEAARHLTAYAEAGFTAFDMDSAFFGKCSKRIDIRIATLLNGQIAFLFLFFEVHFSQ